MKNILKVTIILSLILSSCKENTKKDEKIIINEDIVILTEEQSKNLYIETGILKKDTINKILKVNGKVEVPPQNIISINCPFGGYLKYTKLLIGMSVKKGEIIAKIENIEFIELQKNYLLTKSNLYLSEMEYNRQKSLNKIQASSDKILQQTEIEYKKNKILLKSYSEKLELLNINPTKITEDNISNSINIYSPINGFVSKINANIGKYILDSDILFELIDPTDIHLNLKIFEKDVNYISVGKKIITYSNVNPNKKYEGIIISMGHYLSPEGIIDVICHFNNYENDIVLGMYMNSEIETSSNIVYTLPEESILFFKGKNYVFIENIDKTFTIKEVNIGEKNESIIEILNFNELINKKIVTKGAYTLLMKLKNKED